MQVLWAERSSSDGLDWFNLLLLFSLGLSRMDIFIMSPRQLTIY
jgi:hypothetical protein